MKQLLFALATTLILATGAYAGEFPDISISELKAAIQAKKVIIIDANGTEKWQEGHIPGAIDFETNKEKLANVLPQQKDALVVAYCGGPKCRAYQKAAAAAKGLGYSNIKHLSAGISGWVKAGEQTEKGS